MNHSSGMSGNQAACGLNCNINRVAQRKRATRDFAGQRFALIEGHHDIGAAVGGLLDPVDHTDVGMIQRGRSPGFAQETLFVCFCGNEFVWQKLECDEALELDVEGAVDHTHAAHAGKAQNLVVAYAVACGKRGDCVRHRLVPVSLWREAIG